MCTQLGGNSIKGKSSFSEKEFKISIKFTRGRMSHVLMQYDETVPQHGIKIGAEHKMWDSVWKMQKGWHSIAYTDMSDVLLAAVSNLLLAV
jgi:O-phosphoseryl-tRNA(Cys) synthetase